jgi:hypothetical protein
MLASSYCYIMSSVRCSTNVLVNRQFVHSANDAERRHNEALLISSYFARYLDRY